jgi:tetratricopeptide (TPR) repeat protein
VRVLDATGQYRTADELARHVFEDASALQYAPLLSRAAGLLGTIRYGLGDLAESRKWLTRAIAEAERAHDETLRLTNAARLVITLSADTERNEETGRWRQEVEAGLPHLPATIRCSVAGLLIPDYTLERLDPVVVVSQAEQAVRLCEQLDPPDDELLATALAGLAMARADVGDSQRGRQDLERSLRLLERVLGPEHPELVPVLTNLALYARNPDSDEVRDLLVRALAILDRNRLENRNLLSALYALFTHHLERGEYDRALAYARREHAVAARLNGPASANVARVMADEASALLGLGHLDEALRVARQARELLVDRLGEDVIEVSIVDTTLADVLREQGKLREALAVAERDLRGTIAHSVPADSAGIHVIVGDLQKELGNRREALDHYRAAIEIVERDTTGTVDDAEITARTGLAELALAQGHPGEAVQPLERALALIGTRTLEPAMIARTRFAFARALWQTGDRARALELARAARADYGRSMFPSSRLRADVERWLAGKSVH